MTSSLPDQIREGGYEALFLFVGFLDLASEPTPRNFNRIQRWFEESHARRQHLKRLREKGLVGSSKDRTGAALRLTDLGARVFSGGRQPPEAWSRDWDGQWRLLSFDLPRDARHVRTRFWRWLRANHFGRLQGSAWICPDPVPDIENVVTDFGFDPSALVVFTGTLSGRPSPRAISAQAWDFGTINGAHRDYAQFAGRVSAQISKTTPSSQRFREILRQDRERWWRAVRHDPLLPEALLPKGYAGTAAWKTRLRLLRTLGRAFAQSGS